MIKAKWSAIIVAAFVLMFAESQALAGDEWIEKGTHALAAAQPTPWGKSIHTLCAWNGKLYMGYGDYDKNTGPITVVSYDPKNGVFSNEWTSMTESIDLFRPMMGKIYAPAIDPRGSQPKAAGFAVGDATGRWSDNPVFMEHAFDMTTLTGSDLWLVGSYGDEHSVALRSLDGGATWQKALDLFRKGDNWSRFYYVGVLGDRLYVQSSSDTNSMVFDGSGWTNGPPIARYGHRPEVFAGRMVLKTGKDGLLSFDGVKPAAPVLSDTPIRAFCIAEGTLYILGARDGRIQQTTDLAAWSVVSVAPSNACSIAVLDEMLYVGTRDSKLVQFSKRLPTGDPRSNVPEK